MSESDTGEVGVIIKIAKLLDTLDDKPARQRVLSWAWGKYVGGDTPSGGVNGTPNRDASASNVRRKAKGEVSLKGKKKAPLSMIKDLDFRPKGKDSLGQFVKLKLPTNTLEKSVVCVHYLKEYLEVDVVTTNHVYTAFRSLGWRVPSDLKNTLQQAGSKGWLETSDTEDLQLTAIGENLILHDLPKN